VAVSGRSPDDVTREYTRPSSLTSALIRSSGAPALLPADSGYHAVHGGALFGVPKALPAIGFACNVLASFWFTMNGIYYCENK